jgi:hypothetical protein
MAYLSLSSMSSAFFCSSSSIRSSSCARAPTRTHASTINERTCTRTLSRGAALATRARARPSHTPHRRRPTKSTVCQRNARAVRAPVREPARQQRVAAAPRRLSSPLAPAVASALPLSRSARSCTNKTQLTVGAAAVVVAPLVVVVVVVVAEDDDDDDDVDDDGAFVVDVVAFVVDVLAVDVVAVVVVVVLLVVAVVARGVLFSNLLSASCILFFFNSIFVRANAAVCDRAVVERQ